jgi:uncharacterized protein YjiS (DUF1127 family)
MTATHWTDAIVRFGGSFVRHVSLSALADTVLSWQSRAEERYQLAELDDRALKDLGISRSEALAESRKPFWRV